MNAGAATFDEAAAGGYEMTRSNAPIARTRFVMYARL